MVAARASEFTDASEGSFAVHLEMWDAARDMVASRPLVGWGPGSFRQNSVNHGYSGPTSDPHNFVLQEAAESGVLGAIAVSLVSLGVASWCFVRARGSTQLIGYAAGLLGVLVVCLTQNGFRTELTWAPYAVTLGLVLRGTVGMTDNQQERDLVTWKP
jgi:O-antigen ligase